MGDGLLQLYYALPAALRAPAASARGAWLRWWRYGRDSERLVAEAHERERWTEERLRAWQGERLTYMLRRAATHVPYYRNHWAERRQRGDRSSVELVENWPLLTKDELRTNPTAFIADDRPVRRLFKVNTSGTTGKPLRLWRGKAANHVYYALLEARFLRWNGVTWRRPWAVLGGQVVVPPAATEPPFWVWNAAMHQLYLSANHVSASHAPSYVGALRRYGIGHLEAYASSAAALARECLAAGTNYDGLEVVVTNAEPLHPMQRDVIRRGLGATARETYGMVEIVAGASECPSGTLHLWPDLGFVEVLNDHDDGAAPSGETGRLVCTGLVNDDMPLIRYVVGDRGSLPTSATPCACGRRLPVMGPVEGRSSDMLFAPDGRRVFWVNPVFYGLSVYEAQIIQEGPDQIRIRLVPGSGFAESARLTIIERMRARMGEVHVVVEDVDAIPRGANGKFRPVVNLLGEAPPGAVPPSETR